MSSIGKNVHNTPQSMLDEAEGRSAIAFGSFKFWEESTAHWLSVEGGLLRRGCAMEDGAGLQDEILHFFSVCICSTLLCYGMKRGTSSKVFSNSTRRLTNVFQIRD